MIIKAIGCAIGAFAILWIASYVVMKAGHDSWVVMPTVFTAVFSIAGFVVAMVHFIVGASIRSDEL